MRHGSIDRGLEHAGTRPGAHEITKLRASIAHVPLIRLVNWDSIVRVAWHRDINENSNRGSGCGGSGTPSERLRREEGIGPMALKCVYARAGVYM
jgi:hypothetical protein